MCTISDKKTSSVVRSVPVVEALRLFRRCRNNCIVFAMSSASTTSEKVEMLPASMMIVKLTISPKTVGDTVGAAVGLRVGDVGDELGLALG